MNCLEERAWTSHVQSQVQMRRSFLLLRQEQTRQSFQLSLEQAQRNCLEARACLLQARLSQLHLLVQVRRSFLLRKQEQTRRSFQLLTSVQTPRSCLTAQARRACLEHLQRSFPVALPWVWRLGGAWPPTSHGPPSHGPRSFQSTLCWEGRFGSQLAQAQQSFQLAWQGAQSSAEEWKRPAGGRPTCSACWSGSAS